MAIAAGAAAAEPAPGRGPVEQVVAALARPAPARTAFAEARFMRVLERPLVVSGELAWLGGDSLERRVDGPRAETSTIRGEEVSQQRAGRPARQFSLKRAPQLRVLVDSFVALLGGDGARLGAGFEAALEGDPAAHWTLTLVPRDPRLARTVARIRIDGAAGEARCMTLEEADGDVAIDLLGALAAAMPAAPERARLAALCRGAP